ncbi:hypothetical protein [Nocardia salmonicida]|uniref:hypothetical protein n=1 Tax=Nocardia salmonicida TaxID=53431 RepID=UPI002E2DB571|nr:hypothetical protein [Nocardia salmonicida]
MTSPDHAPIPPESQGQTVGAWGFDDLVDGLFGGVRDFILGWIAGALRDLAEILSGVPVFGDALEDALNGVADFIHAVEATAETAQASADVAYGNANAAYTTATAAQTAASNAASVAAAAQDVADVAYANAQNDRDGFSVSTAGLNLGINEENLGILLTVPAGRTRKITRVVYTANANTGTITLQLIRRALNGTETVVLTTNVASGALVHPDSSIDYTVTDLDQYHCNVTAIGGVVNGLSCWIESIIEET